MANDDPWAELTELGLVDTEYEQAAEATIRLARLARTFYTHLTINDGLPPGLAAPLTLSYVQFILTLSTRKKNE